MKKEQIFEFIKGLLIILSYFIGANLLSFLFLFLINKGIIPDAKYIRNFLNLSIYIILIIFYTIIYHKSLKKDFTKFKKEYRKDIPLSFNYWFKGLFIMVVSNLILLTIFNMGSSVNQNDNVELLRHSLFIQSIITIFLAPYLEEIVFRYSFRKITNNPNIFAYITGFIFGGVHIISSLSSLSGLLYLIPYCAMGVAFGYIYKKTDTIFSSLFIHTFHNAINVILIILTFTLGG